MAAGGVTALFALISFAALREFVTLTPTRRADHAAVAAAFFIVLPVQYGLIWSGNHEIAAAVVPIYAFILLPILAAHRGDITDYAARVAQLQWGLMTAVYSLAHVPAVLTLRIPGFEGRGLLLVAFLLAVVQASDVLQYIWGKLLGRRRIAPSLSPNKTVEGTAFGIASATLIGAGLWWLTPFSPWQAGTAALVLSLAGFAGGLVMSAIKRDRGVKDWGWMIAGHGGVLDRLDSVVFAAPLFFQILRFGWAA